MNKKLFIVIFTSLLFFNLMAHAQGTMTVQGTVLDDAGVPIPGALVSVSGTTRGTMTDIDGKYSISVTSKETLDFSCMGYTSKSVLVGNQGLINVTLSEESMMLNETVVVGYGTQRKVDLTGSVDQVGSDVFAARPNANVTQMLEGAIPNLNISLEDGKPIRTADYNIRGMTSIGQGGSALILIDGVEGDPSMLNPDDIESVSVLKDAAASSIYGSRAPYGVVLITTKNAGNDKVSVNYSNNITMMKPVVEPEYVTDGFLWASMFYEGYFNYNGTKPTDMNTLMPFTVQWITEYRRRHDTGDFGTIVSDGSYGVDAGQYVYFPEGTDWFGLLYKDLTVAQTHNLSISGSSNKFEYYLSGRYYKYYGLYDSTTNTDDCDKENIRLKVGYKPYKWLKFNNNFEFGHSKYNNPYVSSGSAGNIWASLNSLGAPCMPFYNPDGTMTKAAAYTVGGFLYGNSKNVYETLYFKNTIGAKASFFNDTFTVNGDFTFKLDDYNGWTRKYPDTFSPAPDVFETKPDIVSSFNREHTDTKYISANAYADYTNKFDKHYLKVLLGYNYEQKEYERISAVNTDLLSENVENIALTFGTEKKNVTGVYSKWRTAGLFFRADYSYNDRYIVQVNGRYDGSSKFPSNERWAFFPSVSAGWRITEEPWVRPIGKKWLSNAKLRLSYGTLGNSNISAYYYDETLSIGSSRLLNGTIYRSTTAPSPVPTNLTWEKSTTYNGGVDLGFFNNRLQLTGDVYMRITSDMFTQGPSIQAVYGASSPKGNYAQLSTRGYELVLSWKDGHKLGSSMFNYSIRGTFSDNVSVIDKYNNDLGSIGYRNVPSYYAGMTVGEIWGYVCNGLWQSQEEIDVAEAGARAAGQPHYDSKNYTNTNYILYPGDPKIEDLDGNGYISKGDETLSNPGDRTIIGNTSPRYCYSFTLSADWMGFYASVFFQGVGKQDYVPGGDSGMIWGQYNRQYNQIPKWQLGNYWTEDNRDAYLPRYSSRTPLFYGLSTHANTRYLLDVSYIRLKNIQFGYNFPEKWIKHLHLAKASIFFSGENIWDWSPMYKYIKNCVDVLGLGTDPENSDSTAGSGGCYPVMASYSIGINITF